VPVQAHTRPEEVREIFIRSPFSSIGMCLAIPGKVLQIEGNTAKVDFGSGVSRDVDITLVDVRVGQYVLIHVGYAIQVLDKEEAEETLKLWKEILEAIETGP
jgi:hydrogenase expression/formation protein HypC